MGSWFLEWCVFRVLGRGFNRISGFRGFGRRVAGMRDLPRDFRLRVQGLGFRV